VTRTVTIKICTKLPVQIAELPAMGKLAAAAAKPFGVDESHITMQQEGSDLVISFELDILDIEEIP